MGQKRRVATESHEFYCIKCGHFYSIIFKNKEGVIKMPKKIDETGNIYNNFEIIGLDSNNTSQRKKWLCKC